MNLTPAQRRYLASGIADLDNGGQGFVTLSGARGDMIERMENLDLIFANRERWEIRWQITETAIRLFGRQDLLDECAITGVRGCESRSCELHYMNAPVLLGDTKEAIDTLISADIITKDTAEKAWFPNRHGIIESVSLRSFGYGDYFGASYDRANVVSLTRDYSQFLSSRGYTHDGITLELDWESFTNPDNADFALDLAQTLSGIVTDCPVYSDGDLSAVEEEMRGEWWEYGAGDVKEALSERFDVDLSAFSLDADLYGLFMEAHSTIQGEYGYAETATSWVMPGATEPAVIDRLMDEIAKALYDDMPRHCFGQLELFSRYPAPCQSYRLRYHCVDTHVEWSQAA